VKLKVQKASSLIQAHPPGLPPSRAAQKRVCTCRSACAGGAQPRHVAASRALSVATAGVLDEHMLAQAHRRCTYCSYLYWPGCKTDLGTACTGLLADASAEHA